MARGGGAGARRSVGISRCTKATWSCSPTGTGRRWQAGAAARIPDLTLTGTADDVRARIDAFAESGITELAYHAAGPDIPRELRAFADAARPVTPDPARRTARTRRAGGAARPRSRQPAAGAAHRRDARRLRRRRREGRAARAATACASSASRATVVRCRGHWPGRNKRTVELDPETDDGRALLQRLTDVADVVIVNQPHKVLERWGCTYEAIAARNPAAIVVSLSLYGTDGPYCGARRERHVRGGVRRPDAHDRRARRPADVAVDPARRRARRDHRAGRARWSRAWRASGGLPKVSTSTSRCTSP